MGLEPKTDREFFITLGNSVDRLGEAITRLEKTLTDIEDRRLVNIESRLTTLENWKSKQLGIWAAVVGFATILSIASLLISILNAK